MGINRSDGRGAQWPRLESVVATRRLFLDIADQLADAAPPHFFGVAGPARQRLEVDIKRSLELLELDGL
ncbi:MAG: hypothetical protein AAFY88_10465, partial [Acidobacteriota bacterium]